MFVPTVDISVKILVWLLKLLNLGAEMDSFRGLVEMDREISSQNSTSLRSVEFCSSISISQIFNRESHKVYTVTKVVTP